MTASAHPSARGSSQASAWATTQSGSAAWALCSPEAIRSNPISLADG